MPPLIGPLFIAGEEEDKRVHLSAHAEPQTVGGPATFQWPPAVGQSTRYHIQRDRVVARVVPEAVGYLEHGRSAVANEAEYPATRFRRAFRYARPKRPQPEEANRAGDVARLQHHCRAGRRREPKSFQLPRCQRLYHRHAAGQQFLRLQRATEHGRQRNYSDERRGSQPPDTTVSCTTPHPVALSDRSSLERLAGNPSRPLVWQHDAIPATFLASDR